MVEVDKYFSSDSERQCKTTYYADANGAYVDSNGCSTWLLRSPGISSDDCCRVLYDGCVGSHCSVDNGGSGIRPALWINLP